MDSDTALGRAGDILTMYPGPDDLLVDTGVSFTPGITAEQMLEAIHRGEARVQAARLEANRLRNEVESLPVLPPAETGR
jgi:hypothetical protein